MTPTNDLGQPIGPALPGWRPPVLPEPIQLAGQRVRLDPIAPVHAEGIWHVLAPRPELWTYRSDEPPADRAATTGLIERLGHGPDVTLAVIRLRDLSFQGMLTLLRADPPHGTVEVGSIIYSPDLQRTPATTEAAHLVARHVFELGYRRLEWKCDSLNTASRQAAVRLGFTEEGTFRNARVYKGRSRDTTWFSITDDEWPRIRAAHRRWLDPANFDAHGHQRRPLSDLLA